MPLCWTIFYTHLNYIILLIGFIYYFDIIFINRQHILLILYTNYPIIHNISNKILNFFINYYTRGYYTMRELKATKINTADFAPFGTLCIMTEPEGYPLQGEIHKFYPDRISGNCIGSMGFSPIAVHKDERIIKAAEYHTTTWEGIVALDDDMIIHVAPASAGTPVPELTRAFIVPKGTMVKINAAIWHLCPLPLNNEVLHAMIILPECTYANDCTVVDFEEKDWFRITI